MRFKEILTKSKPRSDFVEDIRVWFSLNGIEEVDNLASPLEIIVLPHTQDIKLRLRNWKEGKISSYDHFLSMKDEFENFISKSGWHLTMINRLMGKQLGNVYELKIAPNYPDKPVSVPRFLYHYTNRKNIENILKNGLLPKAMRTNDKYPPRIYLMKKDGYGAWEASEILKSEGATELLKIDTSMLDIDFYSDPELMDAGVWTYETIRPEFIEYIK